MFYSEEPSLEKPVITEIDSLDKELDAGREAALLETKLSSLVWICTSTRAASIVTVIDANNPAEILNSFGVCANHLMCIASVPGASPSDYDSVTKTNSENVNSENVVENKEDAVVNNSDSSKDNDINNAKEEEAEVDPESLVGRVTFVEKDESVVNKRDRYTKNKETAENSEVSETSSTNEDAVSKDSEEEQTGKTPEEDNKSNEEKPESNGHEVMSSVLATMWLGAQSGMLYVHSSVASWNQCLHSVKLSDAVLSIV